MQLIDNTNKILSGSISKTGDFEMYKKVIGVNSSNLTPNMQGIVPLANTSSLEKEKIEPVASEQVMESLDLGSDVNTDKKDIPSIDLGSLNINPESEVPDLQGAVPVSVEDTSALESIDLPKIPSLDSSVETQPVEKKQEIIPDLKLPDFSEVKMDIPAVPEVSSEMFIDSVVPNQSAHIQDSSMNEISSLENKNVEPSLSEINGEIPTNNLPKMDDTVENSNINVNAKFKKSNNRKEEMLKKIMSFISDEIDLYLSEMQTINSSKNVVKDEKTLEEIKTSDMSNMVDNMISRIQDNPGLPEEEGKLSL